MIKRGIATFTLDDGRCPPWLFERMVKLARPLIDIIVSQYGAEEFIWRIADPVWFQSLGTLLAFDWNASGLTTVLTAVLKEAVRKRERQLGFFICGGKGRTSRKTPEEIKKWAMQLGLPTLKAEALLYGSRLSAKVDNCLLQDGFQLYHHVFFFTREGSWAVVQQGMNTQYQAARRYHWYCSKEQTKDFVRQPHQGIITQLSLPTLDLTAEESESNRKLSLELVSGSFSNLIKDLKLLARHKNNLSLMVSFAVGKDNQYTFLKLNKKDDFLNYPPISQQDFGNNSYLQKVLYQLCQLKPHKYEELIAQEGVGSRTVRALSLVAEVLYGARPSYQDPARYSFAHGGKDGVPYAVNTKTYDKSIAFWQDIASRLKISPYLKTRMLRRLDNFKK